jgi:hypothetical protein
MLLLVLVITNEMYFVFALVNHHRSIGADHDHWPFDGNKPAAPGSFALGLPTFPDLKPRSMPDATPFAAALAALIHCSQRE